MSRRNNSGIVGANKFGAISRMSEGAAAAPRYATTIGKLRGRFDDRKYYRGINLAETNKYDVARAIDSDYFVDLLKEYNPLALYAADRGLYTGRSTQLTAASNQYWTINSNSTLQIAGQDFWVSVWVKINPTSPYQTIAAKTANYSSDSEWGLNVWGAGNPAARFGTFHVKNRTVEVFTAANAVPDATWTHMFAWVSVADGAIYIRANNGAVTSTALGAAITSNTNPLRVGFASNAYGGLEGELDSLMLGKSPTPIGDGTNGSLAHEISTYLFNAGSGRVYADLSTAQKTAWGLVSAYDFDGDGLDSHGTNHLTAVNSPTYAAGKPNKAATTTGDPIVIWEDQSGNNRHLSQDTLSKRPTLVLNYQYGEPALLFDGTDDFLSTALSFTTFPNKRGTLIAVVKNTVSGNYGTIAATYIGTSPDWQAFSSINTAKYIFYDSNTSRTGVNFDVQNLPTLKTFWRDSDTTMKHRRNADESDSLTHANIQMASNPLYLGAISNGIGGTQDFFTGYIMSLALFGDLSLDNVRELEFILNNHYRIYS